MTDVIENNELTDEPPIIMGGGSASPEPQFILYQDGPDFVESVRSLDLWVRHLLLPVYGHETTSQEPWCPRWWEHSEAVAQLFALWMAWQDLTGPGSSLIGPANWHRDYLEPVMNSLRNPQGVFAGCKPGGHRAKVTPQVDDFDR